MECKALYGALSGRRIFGLERDQLQCQQHILSNSWSRTVPPKTRTTQVRAVTTESKPASGRRARREQNVAGEFFVDKTCINCDTCRWMSPTVFSEIGGQSAVIHQPNSEEERLTALQALLACPTSSIRTVTLPKDIKEVHRSFPLAIDPSLPGVYHCGYHSELSFAATSYFITRPEGNILVDSPRYSEQLATRLEEMGGVRYMFCTHKDDLADHKKWNARFKCERILHKSEVTANSTSFEVKLEGEGNWNYFGSDIELIFTPGHTEGHVCLLLKDLGVLFSGDHLGASQHTNKLKIDRVHNWYSVPLQIDSVEALIRYDFTWILPGHGRRYRFQSIEEKNDVLSNLVAEARRVPF